MPLTSTLAFDFPTVEALATHLLGRIAPPAAASRPASAAPELQDDVLLKIEELSDEQVEQLLARRLAVDGV